EYLITRSNGSQLVFNDLGRLVKIRQSIWTDTVEEIEIEYDTEHRPWKVHAPDSDNRYIRFNYPVGTDPQVESVDLVAGTEVYEGIVTYEYGAAGLERVNYGGTNTTFSRIYEHGSFDPLDEEYLDTTTVTESIGRLSIIVDGGSPQPVYAYEY